MDKMNCEKCSRFCASRVPIFENLESHELDEIVSEIEHKSFEKGSLIFTEGSSANTLYFINEGKIKLYKYNKDGKEQIFHILTNGDFFGELDLIKSSKYKFNAKAMDNAKICTLKKNEVKDIVLKNPEIALKLLESVGERLAAIENLAQNLSTNDVDARIAYLLLNLMDKYSEELEGKKLIKLPLSREDMANYIGVTRETISRKLKKFEDEGFIKLVGTKKILVLDEEALDDCI
ncbi:Crp/Fnr family transcriptional regulator [Clostridium sp. SM-530-WT-3G]|uniref:Crp/Fnr family transcriptional regulator n=1 Tax=Clostridium sp. SM-530-WT-3G TaxID=2725303 RepID=UPI00145EF69A|nr:Crp/Fnr family transcriptional regulator [Clostridium sp. SM-530-WT-3G]NME82082.1 Crp/Fnr family transcriptional regulator [Clostridium sp. SM-530-WT-3G]